MYLVRPPYLIKRYYPRAVWRKNPEEKKIYLTFDDGPIPIITPWVLNLLKEENIKATFFCVGNNVEKYPTVYNQIIADGHSVGNHTYNHLNGWNTDTNKYLDNVTQCHRLVESNLFRPPYGKLKKSQLSNLNSDYSIIMWDLLSGDYDSNTSPEQCLKNVEGNIRNGSIILFHDSVKAERNMEFALPRFITFAKQNGYLFDKL